MEVRVKTPPVCVDTTLFPLLAGSLANSSTSGAAGHPPLIVPVALASVALSTSRTAIAGAMTTGVEVTLAPSAKATVPPPVVRTGASFTGLTVIRIDSVIESTPPLAVPPESWTL
mgnify:CR=1 FL=1